MMEQGRVREVLLFENTIWMCGILVQAISVLEEMMKSWFVKLSYIKSKQISNI